MCNCSLVLLSIENKKQKFNIVTDLLKANFNVFYFCSTSIHSFIANEEICKTEKSLLISKEIKVNLSFLSKFKKINCFVSSPFQITKYYMEEILCLFKRSKKSLVIIDDILLYLFWSKKWNNSYYERLLECFYIIVNNSDILISFHSKYFKVRLQNCLNDFPNVFDNFFYFEKPLDFQLKKKKVQLINIGSLLRFFLFFLLNMKTEKKIIIFPAFDKEIFHFKKNFFYNKEFLICSNRNIINLYENRLSVKNIKKIISKTPFILDLFLFEEFDYYFVNRSSRNFDLIISLIYQNSRYNNLKKVFIYNDKVPLLISCLMLYKLIKCIMFS